MEKLEFFYDENRGELFIGKESSIILNRGGQSGINAAFEEVVGPAARTIIYRLSKDLGIRIAKSIHRELIKEHSRPTKKQVVLKLFEQLRKRGCGVPELLDWNKEDLIFRIKVKNCSNAEGIRNSKKTRCYWISGILAGAFELIFGEPIDCVETKCLSMGAEHCEFELKKAERVEAHESQKIQIGYLDRSRIFEKVSLDFDEENGEIIYRGIQAEIHPRDQIARLQIEFEGIIGPATRTIAYEWGKKHAIRVVTNVEKIIIKTVGLLSKKAIAAQLAKNQITPRGLGVGEVAEWDDNKQFVRMRVSNCFNAVGYRTPKKPICYVMAGIFAGAGTVVFGTDMDCIETKCIAIGDPYCEFDVFPRKRIESVEDILKVLSKIPGVEGSMVIARDGLLMASYLPGDIDADRFAAMIATVMGSAVGILSKLNRGYGERIIVDMTEGKLILRKCGVNANLVVLTERYINNLDLILTSIDDTSKKIDRELKR